MAIDNLTEFIFIGSITGRRHLGGIYQFVRDAAQSGYDNDYRFIYGFYYFFYA